jgi:amidohydrolase
MKRQVLVAVLTIAAAILLAIGPKPAQEAAAHSDGSAPAGGQHWRVVNRKTTPLNDGPRIGIHLSEAPGDGLAWLEGAEITDGILEFDVRGSDVFQRSFVGVAFHGVDEKTYEAVYFRPFNFRSDDTVRRSHAVQYVSPPAYPWERLRREWPGRYEQAIQPSPDPNGWFHVRVVLAGANISVFVGDNQKPSLTVERLASQRGGSVGFWVGNGSGGDFANLKVLPPSDSAAMAREPFLGGEMDKRLESLRLELIELRHDLHRHPEPSGAEIRTAATVASRLRALGLQVTTGIGGNGVVALLQGGRPGPVVAYRADMDAVRTDLPDPAPFRSETPGVRHICGHDVHTAVALGVAEALAAVRERLPGSVKFIFQPAEENVQGARAMLKAGVLENPRPAAIFALHTGPLPVGVVSCSTAMALPGFDLAIIRLSGTGNLATAARTLSQKIMAFNTVPSPDLAARAGNQSLEPIRDFVFPEVDPGKMQGDTWVMEAYVRASSEENYARTKRAIQDVVTRANADGVRAELEYQDRRLPDAVNDAGLARRAAESIRRVLGPERTMVYEGAVPYFGEDFAFFQKQVPGVLFFLGVSNPERGIVGLPHAPFYQADDDAIQVGARAMANVLAEFLAQGRP